MYFLKSCKKPVLKITFSWNRLLDGVGQQGQGVQQGVEVLHAPHLHHLRNHNFNEDLHVILRAVNDLIMNS